MSPRRRAQLQVIETEPDRAVTRLHHLIRHRDALRGPFRDCWEAISVGAADADLERWAEASLELASVNAGPDCQLAFWRASVDFKVDLALRDLADFAHAAANICRGARARAALACLQALPAALRRLPTTADIALWSRGLVRLAREAPESVVAVASRRPAQRVGPGAAGPFEGGDDTARAVARGVQAAVGGVLWHAQV